VQLQAIPWVNSRQQIIDFALQEKAPDISHIGSTWTISFSAMNVLRPFSRREIHSIGGPSAFVRPAWESALPEDSGQAWSVPWSVYTFILVYRRDLLAAAGVDEREAFVNAEAMENTLRTLQAAGIERPWVITTSTTWDLIHQVASWVWGAGGAYLSDNGKRILFHRPEALAGLEAFFRLYRYLPQPIPTMTSGQCLDLFRQGEAAVTIVAVESVTHINEEEWAPEVRENLGVAALPGRPWVGGDNLVVWGSAHSDKRHDRTAVDLARYLVSKEAQIAFYRSVGALPARADVMGDLTFDVPSLTPVLRHIFARGQSYVPIRLWSRVESELRRTFESIVAILCENPDADIKTVLKTYLDPLAKHLALMLGL
jgi:multiple sugar transport system substrate-binding protein